MLAVGALREVEPRTGWEETLRAGAEADLLSALASVRKIHHRRHIQV